MDIRAPKDTLRAGTGCCLLPAALHGCRLASESPGFAELPKLEAALLRRVWQTTSFDKSARRAAETAHRLSAPPGASPLQERRGDSTSWQVCQSWPQKQFASGSRSGRRQQTLNGVLAQPPCKGVYFWPQDTVLRFSRPCLNRLPESPVWLC